MDKNLSKPVQIQVSDQIALAEIFYFKQVFVFCMSINKKTSWNDFY